MLFLTLHQINMGNKLAKVFELALSRMMAIVEFCRNLIFITQQSDELGRRQTKTLDLLPTARGSRHPTISTDSPIVDIATSCTSTSSKISSSEGANLLLSSKQDEGC